MQSKIRLDFLGTGAADWVTPAPDGTFRRFTSTLVDQNILLDFTKKSLDTLEKADAHVEYVLYTHSHRDHFDPEALRILQRSRTEKGLAPLKIYAEASWAREIDCPGAEITGVSVGSPFSLGEYQITPLPANHSTERTYEQPLHYLFQHQDGTNWLYATDGAWLMNPVMKAMRKAPLSGLVIDATIGDGHAGDWRIFEHNSLPMLRIMAETLTETGMLLPGGKIYLTHMARTLHGSRAQVEAALSEPFVLANDSENAWIENMGDKNA